MSRSFISHAAIFIVLGHIPLQAADLPAQSPTLERILKNWQARQDRTKSVHMAWDTKAEPNNTDKDAGFRMLHHELWMDGENRSRLQQALTQGAGSQLTRFGKTEASYAWQFGSAQPFLADIWMAGDPPKTQGYELNWEVDPRMAVAAVRPLYIALRPLVSQAATNGPTTFAWSPRTKSSTSGPLSDCREPIPKTSSSKISGSTRPAGIPSCNGRGTLRNSPSVPRRSSGNTGRTANGGSVAGPRGSDRSENRGKRRRAP